MSNEANADMGAYWNGEGGDKWLSFEARLEESLKPFGTRAIDALAPAGDDQVLEIGCGCGPNTIELARRLGADGRVKGLDISATILERAEKNAQQSGLGNLAFDCIDVQTGDLGRTHYDRAFSRFGVMFFDEPAIAFKNIANALKPGGHIAFACWAAPRENLWVAEPLQLVGKHVSLPPPPEPGTPGPFSLSKEERVREILSEAGFVKVAIELYRAPMVLGASIAEAVEFLMNMAPSGGAVSQADPDAATRAAIREDLGKMLESQLGPDGVTMTAAALIVTAEKP